MRERKKYHQELEKMQGVKKRDIETQSQDDSIEKGNIGKILNKKNMEKERIRKIFNQTRSKTAKKSKSRISV